MIFISGQLGKDPISGKLISENIEAETSQVMENLKAELIKANTEFSYVIKSSMYLTDIEDLDKVNKVYASYFSGDYPACEVFEASGLELNAHIQISMIVNR